MAGYHLPGRKTVFPCVRIKKEKLFFRLKRKIIFLSSQDEHSLCFVGTHKRVYFHLGLDKRGNESINQHYPNRGQLNLTAGNFFPMNSFPYSALACLPRIRIYHNHGTQFSTTEASNPGQASFAAPSSFTMTQNVF